MRKIENSEINGLSIYIRGASVEHSEGQTQLWVVLWAADSRQSLQLSQKGKPDPGLVTGLQHLTHSEQ